MAKGDITIGGFMAYLDKPIHTKIVKDGVLPRKDFNRFMKSITRHQYRVIAREELNQWVKYGAIPF